MAATRAPLAALALSTLSLAALACGETTAGPDAGAPADGGASADARPGDDAGPGADAAPDAGPSLDAEPRPDAGATEPPPFEWPVETGTVAITPDPSWKNRITRDDPFVVVPADLESPRWVKFTILLRDPGRVYFQDSARYPFHYEFATERLDPWRGLDRAALDRVSLGGPDQALVFGAVLFPADGEVLEYGVQLVGRDAYHPELVRRLVERVRAAVDAPGHADFYFPVFEQRESAERWTDWLAARDVRVSSPERWASGHGCYAPGWAWGRLVQVPAAELEAAFGDGRLRPEDVLLTDGVPAEIPLVAGVLSLSPATPNSHVAILAQSFGVPFAWLAVEPERGRALAAVGRKVAVEVVPGEFGGPCRVKVLDLDGRLSPELEAELGRLAAPPELSVPGKRRAGQIGFDVDMLGPGDAERVGGKAANYGVLRDAIPEAAPPAVALSFDLWDGFMAQVLPGGERLDARAARVLGGHAWPPDVARLRRELAELRATIEDETVFTPEQEAAIQAALAGFPSDVRLRLRSSTNVEDGEHFSGAGLYDSVSGCLADDLDGDAIGPSLCDASKREERGVLRALRRVFASFYRENAVLERLRHRVPEAEVGMAVLVHPSYPDPEEEANGVAVLERAGNVTRLRLVSQHGAVSVANPEPGVRPETVELEAYRDQLFTPTLQIRSSLVPLGATVMRFPEDYEALARLLLRASEAWVALRPGPRVVLDLEYKKMAGRGLIVKQLRPIPQPDRTPSVAPILVDAPSAPHCVFQGESSDALALHRLKSRWALRGAVRRLDEAGLATSPLAGLELELVVDGATLALSGPPDALPGAGYRLEADQLVHGLRVDTAAGPRQVELRLGRPALRRRTELPLMLADEWPSVELAVTHPEDVPELDWMGAPSTRREDFARLVAGCPEDRGPRPGDVPVERAIELGGGRRLELRFWWPAPPRGITAGYTAPLARWGDSRLVGFGEDAALGGPWSLTYRPGHHNFSESFVIEPTLEPGLPATTRAALEAADVRVLHVDTGSQTPVYAIGADGRLRAWR